MMTTARRPSGPLIILGAAVFVSACGDIAPPEVIPAPGLDSTTSFGTEEAPMVPGEARQISHESIWTVKLEDTNGDAYESMLADLPDANAPDQGFNFVAGTFTVTFDQSQYNDSQESLDEFGVDARLSLVFEYVAADGQTFDFQNSRGCYTSEMLSDHDPIYRDGDSATGDICIQIPTSQVDGGTWRVTNLSGDSVWISSQ